MPDAQRSDLPRQPARPARVLLVATEDWFVASHFKPLVRAIVGLGLPVTVAARFDKHETTIRELGAATRALDLRRGGFNPIADIGGFVRLLRVLWAVRPDIVHAIALKPAFLSALAFQLSPARALVLHPTGVGVIGTEQRGGTRMIAGAIMALLRAMSRRARVWVVAENPDDLAAFSSPAARAAGRVTLLGGAGVDPDHFTALPPPDTSPVTAAFVGRMVWSKGVDRLVEAQQVLRARDRPLDLLLCGAPDPSNPRAIDVEQLARWRQLAGVHWLGHVDDPRTIWARAAIAVVPSRGGEGLPRALLEAAASARPLVVTDVPGCRDFVRQGIEGLIVPPDDAAALADALAMLAGDAGLRTRMGAAARARLLAGYTEADVMAKVAATYRALADLG